MKTTHRRIAEILDRHIRGREYGVTRLAGQLGISPRTVDRWCSDESTPTAADLLEILRAVCLHQPERGLRLADEVLGLVGLWCYSAPPVEARPGDAHGESCDVVEAAADLEREARNAARDGQLSAAEQARIANAARRVVRESLEVPAVALAAGTSERELALGDAR